MKDRCTIDVTSSSNAFYVQGHLHTFFKVEYRCQEEHKDCR